MFVVKRDGRHEEINFDKITRRVTALVRPRTEGACPESERLSTPSEWREPMGQLRQDGDLVALPRVDVIDISKKVVAGVFNGVRTVELDTLAAETCAQLVTVHPDYGSLASRIFVSSLHKETPTAFSQCVETVSAQLRPEFVATVNAHASRLDQAIDDRRDYLLTYFGLKTLEKSYLLKHEGKVMERPQYMFMRVAVAIHGEDIGRAIETYNLMSTKHFIHATPTLFNAGRHMQQLSSCFLTQIEKDSIDGIFTTIKNCALISKSAGGIGLSVSNVRATGSPISGGGTSNGLLPMLRVVNNVARYVDQGGNKRPGAVAVYVEPWHADIFDVLDLRKNHGVDERRARDLFTALWVPDIFMRRVKANADWSLFCPSVAPGLDECWGEAFDKLYTEYEQTKERTVVPAQKLWAAIIASQIETGTPYMLYKDAANRTSNHNHLGTLKGSNLCVAPETLLLTDKGYRAISSLEDQAANVWNGCEWSEVTVRETSKLSQLIRVNLDNGTYLECTPYHKFYIVDEHTLGSVQVSASNLVAGNRLVRWTPPVVDADERMSDAYMKGYALGPSVAVRTYSDRQVLDVPARVSARDKVEWLSGLVDAIGHTVESHIQSTKVLIVPATDIEFLRSVQLLLHTVSAHSTISVKNTGVRTATPDGLKGQLMSETMPVWNLVVDSASLCRLVSLGLRPRNIDVSQGDTSTAPRRGGGSLGGSALSKYVTVVSVVDEGRSDRTFCFTEPKRGMGVFNGIITGQCVEIMEYFDKDETAVCNLASIGLPAFVNNDRFDFEKLQAVTRVAVRNLDNIIDINSYPIPEARKSNIRHRPIGLGVQGLADVFAELRMPFDSTEARKLNREIFESIYYAALSSSCDIAREKGVYPSYEGSRVSRGILHCDTYNVDESGHCNFTELRSRIAKYGVRNSLLVAPMPTASTSQILGYNECIEPYTSNIYNRRVKSGEFQVVNHRLIRELESLGMWGDEMKNNILHNNGSIAGISSIPPDVRQLYRTVWEISQKAVIDMAADRTPYIDQSQSLNIHIEDATLAKMTSMHFYGWERGLKSGMYYLRTRPAAKSIQFTVGVDRVDTVKNILQGISSEPTEQRGSPMGLALPTCSDGTYDAGNTACYIGCESCSA